MFTTRWSSFLLYNDYLLAQPGQLVDFWFLDSYYKISRQNTWLSCSHRTKIPSLCWCYSCKNHTFLSTLPCLYHNACLILAAAVIKIIIHYKYFRTNKRASTFYDGTSDEFKGVQHIPMCPAFCDSSRQVCYYFVTAMLLDSSKLRKIAFYFNPHGDKNMHNSIVKLVWAIFNRIQLHVYMYTNELHCVHHHFCSLYFSLRSQSNYFWSCASLPTSLFRFWSIHVKIWTSNITSPALWSLLKAHAFPPWQKARCSKCGEEPPSTWPLVQRSVNFNPVSKGTWCLKKT